MTAPIPFFVYDIEIARAVPSHGEARNPGLDYCEGWHDHAGMGVACVGYYSSRDDRYGIATLDNVDDFLAAMEGSFVAVGFNNVLFDNPVLAANDWPVPLGEHYDILSELTAGKNSRRGCSLDATARANFGIGKVGSGADAPALHQRGEWGPLVEYCLRDVWLTKRLFDRVLRDGFLVDPTVDTSIVAMRRPTG